MKIDWSFPKKVFIALLVVMGIGFYPLVKFGDDRIIVAAITGALLSTINVLCGYAAIEYSFEKSMTTFFLYVLGGMGIRMCFLALMMIVLIRLFDVHMMALVGSMGIFYVIYLTLEIFYIQKKIQSRQNFNA